MNTEAESDSKSSSGRSASLPRWFWFVAALLVFVLSTVVAFRQEPRPDAYRQANPLQVDWWRYPIEFNADRRLPRVWADLNDVYSLKGTGHVWVVGNAGLVLHSENYGRHWTRRHLSGFSPPGESGGSSGGGGGFRFEGRPGSRPGEETLSRGVLAKSDLYSVHFLDDRNGWVAGDNGALFSTRDSGQTWTQRDAGVGRVNFRVVYFSGVAEGWVVVADGSQLRTSNQGETWKRASIAGLRLIEKATFGSDTFTDSCFLRKARYSFCSQNGEISILRLSGSSAAQTAPAAAYLRALLQDPAAPISVDVLSSRQAKAVADKGVFQWTEDGGATWSERRLDAHQEFRSVSFSDSQRGWIAGARGTVLATDDGGDTWRRATRSLPGNVAERAALVETSRSHRIWPAPWYFLSLGLAGLLLAPALKTPKPAVIAESVADLLVSDRPISAGDRDVFDFQRVALGLSRFLRNEKTVPPLTIAVTGEWGTGKSSLMNLLQDDLKLYGFRPVWFNAWHHQKEEHLLASLLATVRSQAVPPWWRPEGAIFRLRLLRIRWARYWPLIAFLLVVFSFSLGYFRSHPGQLDAAWNSVKAIPSVVADPENWLRDKSGKASVPSLALLISGAGLLVSLWKGIKGFGVNPASLLARDSARTRVSDLEKLTGFRHQFAAEFRDITQALNPRTMVVMIDDLDRCRPEMVLEVLESVNFLISSGDCFVVLGMARERVIRCVGLSFKDVASELLVTQARPDEKDLPAEELARRRRIEFAQQYLEKLINIEVPVPVPTYAQSSRLLRESAPKEEAPESQRERMWRAVWDGIRKALPAAAAVALLFLGYWIGATRTGGGEPIVRNTAPVKTQPPAQGVTAPPTPNLGKESAGSSIRRAPAEMEAAREARLPILLAVVLLLVLLGLGVWRLSIPPGIVLHDSREFEEALGIWHPMVFTFRNTPRATKRFLNRVRYFAMLQRGYDPEPSRWRQFLALLWSFVRRKQREEVAREVRRQRDAIPEHALVALVAIEHARPDWFESDSFFNDPRNVSNSIPGNMLEIVLNTPLKTYRDAYLQMSRGVRVR
ncbi:MAG TPA: YCF48-related protein [Thermoanaerobaculia bacterium]